MGKASFFVLLWARFLQIVGFGLAFYGVFIAAIGVGLKQGGFSYTLLIPILGIVLFVWGCKILYDNGSNIIPH